MKRIRAVFAIGGMYGGGAERQLVTILKHLDRTRFQPFLHLIRRTGPLLSEIPDDVPVTSFDELWKGPQWPQPLMHGRRVSVMKAYLRDVQADVCYDRTFLMTLQAAAAAQSVGVPNVSTVVIEPRRAFSLLAGRFKTVKRGMLHRLYLKSTCVLANSYGAARAAEEFYRLPDQRIQTIYNSLDVGRVQTLLQQDVASDWWQTGCDRPVFRIVAAGRLTAQKGFDLLIQAASEFQRRQSRVELRMVIIGDGVDRTMLQEKINQLGLQNQVKLPGFMHNPVAWYGAADLVVLSSLFEGFPNVLMEAMACGTPVLAADCPFGPAELLENGRWGQMSGVGDSHDLASQMIFCLNHRDMVQHRASLAQRHVCDQFGVSKMMSQLESVLIESATQKRNGATDFKITGRSD